MESIYFDTSIWLDIYENRGYNGRVAKKAFRKALKENSIIAYSDLISAELKRLGYTKDEINIIFAVAKPNNLRKLHIYKEQADEARKLAKQKSVPKADALHTILCRDNNAQLISRDHDYEKLKHIAKANLPEEFI